MVWSNMWVLAPPPMVSSVSGSPSCFGSRIEEEWRKESSSESTVPIRSLGEGRWWR